MLICIINSVHDKSRGSNLGLIWSPAFFFFLMDLCFLIELHLHGWLLDDIIKAGGSRCLAWHLHRHFCGFTSHRTNNGSALAFVPCSTEVGYFHPHLDPSQASNLRQLNLSPAASVSLKSSNVFSGVRLFEVSHDKGGFNLTAAPILQRDAVIGQWVILDQGPVETLGLGFCNSGKRLEEKEKEGGCKLKHIMLFNTIFHNPDIYGTAISTRRSAEQWTMMDKVHRLHQACKSCFHFLPPQGRKEEVWLFQRCLLSQSTEEQDEESVSHQIQLKTEQKKRQAAEEKDGRRKMKQIFCCWKLQVETICTCFHKLPISQSVVDTTVWVSIFNVLSSWLRLRKKNPSNVTSSHKRPNAICGQTSFLADRTCGGGWGRSGRLHVNLKTKHHLWCIKFTGDGCVIFTEGAQSSEIMSCSLFVWESVKSKHLLCLILYFTLLYFSLILLCSVKLRVVAQWLAARFWVWFPHLCTLS